MNDKEDFDRKDHRRKKIKIKTHKKQVNPVDSDFVDQGNPKKDDIKKIKESFKDEEWEDWDRYYNH